MGTVIAVANQKGGVGKTTTTLNLGTEIAMAGRKVLLVDFDHQANLTLSCGIKNFDELPETIADYMKSEIDGIEPDIHTISYRENVDLIPANVRLAHVNLELTQAMAREFILKNLIAPLKDRYDYILIDCAPSLSVDLINALTAADEVMIVSTPSKFSTSGTEELVKSILRVKKNLNQDLKIAGVLMNRVDRRNNFTNDMIDLMKTSWGAGINIFETEIPASIRVDESQAMGQPLHEYDPKNKLTTAYKEFAKEFLERDRG